MDIFTISGGQPLRGELTVAGAKNVALKAFVAALLTDETVILHNIPDIGDVHAMLDVLKSLGVTAEFDHHTVSICSGKEFQTAVPLEIGARLRTSSMVIGPMLARFGRAMIPNPGGCRIGARPIDRHIQGLVEMGADISYNSDDGYFHATAPRKLQGTTFQFPKNTHTGTETILLAAVLARGKTVLQNAAQEVEVDDLIGLLCAMGARIKRQGNRKIVIEGVDSLHGTEYSIMPDRNEEVTFGIAAAMTDGDIVVHNSQLQFLEAFHRQFVSAGGGMESVAKTSTRYFRASDLHPTDVVTAPYPGFMTDWQAPWAVLMTQVDGTSTIHETIFESRFSYVAQLRKMGTKIDFFDPVVADPETFYNFNWTDRVSGYHQGIRIFGPTRLHNAILTMDDLRAGATLILAALSAGGESYIHGVEHVDRGYEKIEERLQMLGARIKRVKEDSV